MRRPFMLLAALLALAGCGLKDDLYLPPPKQPVATPAAAPATAPSPDEDDERAPATTGTATAPAGATAPPPANP